MNETLEFSAEIRENKGTGAARFYRKEGKIPAIIYGPGQETLKLSVEETDLNMAYNKPGFKTKLININIDGKVKKVVAVDIQVHPVTDKIEHVDFMYAGDGQISKILVDFKYINFDKSMGIKRGGKLNIILRSIYILCSAPNAPKFVEIDISKMNIGDKIREQDLILPAGVKLFSKNNRTIVTLNGKNKADPNEAAESTESSK